MNNRDVDAFLSRRLDGKTYRELEAIERRAQSGVQQADHLLYRKNLWLLAVRKKMEQVKHGQG